MKLNKENQTEENFGGSSKKLSDFFEEPGTVTQHKRYAKGFPLSLKGVIDIGQVLPAYLIICAVTDIVLPRPDTKVKPGLLKYLPADQ